LYNIYDRRMIESINEEMFLSTTMMILFGDTKERLNLFTKTLHTYQEIHKEKNTVTSKQIKLLLIAIFSNQTQKEVSDEEIGNEQDTFSKQKASLYTSSVPYLITLAEDISSFTEYRRNSNNQPINILDIPRIFQYCRGLIHQEHVHKKEPVVTPEIDLGDMPKHIYISDGKASVNERYYSYVDKKRIFIKSNPHDRFKDTQYHSNWTLCKKNGLPQNDIGVEGYPSCDGIKKISTDGWNLIAEGDNSILYYLRFRNNFWPKRDTDFQWQGRWGKPFSDFVKIPEHRALSVSHRHEDVKHFTDSNGTKHISSVGVTQVFMLSPNGRHLTLIDPWIPPSFYLQSIPMPNRDHFEALNVASAASMILLISPEGKLYSRFIDFDTMGSNFGLKYTFKEPQKIKDWNAHDSWDDIKKSTTSFVRDVTAHSLGIKEIATVIRLPPEDWKKVTDLPNGALVNPNTITVLQTGVGNLSREFRIEGKQSNDSPLGYFHKTYISSTWKFSEYQEYDYCSTTSKADLLEIDHQKKCSLPPRIHSNAYAYSYKRKKHSIQIKFDDYNPHCSPGFGSISINGNESKMELHFFKSSIKGFLSKNIPKTNTQQMVSWDDYPILLWSRGVLLVSTKSPLPKSLFPSFHKNIDENNVTTLHGEDFVIFYVRVKYNSKKKILMISQVYRTQYPQVYLPIFSEEINWSLKQQ